MVSSPTDATVVGKTRLATWIKCMALREVHVAGGIVVAVKETTGRTKGPGVTGTSDETACMHGIWGRGIEKIYYTPCRETKGVMSIPVVAIYVP